VQARAGDLAQIVQDGHSTASPRIKAALDAVYSQLWTLSAGARRIAERQGEQAAFLAIRLNAQAKGEIDALKRAVREGRLTPPRWSKVASVAFFRNVGANEHQGEEGPSERAAGSGSSRNALITVEPWRCRLPVVRGNGSDALAADGSSTHAPFALLMAKRGDGDTTPTVDQPCRFK
jgi:hypothetical protein